MADLNKSKWLFWIIFIIVVITIEISIQYYQQEILSIIVIGCLFIIGISGYLILWRPINNLKLNNQLPNDNELNQKYVQIKEISNITLNEIKNLKQKYMNQTRQESQEVLTNFIKLQTKIEDLHCKLEQLPYDEVIKLLYEKTDLFNNLEESIKSIYVKVNSEDINKDNSLIIEDNLQKLNQSIQSYNEIHKQLELLALNAAILASQAGIHGKSFSVVSEQLKDLSSRFSLINKEMEIHYALLNDNEREDKNKKIDKLLLDMKELKKKWIDDLNNIKGVVQKDIELQKWNEKECLRIIELSSELENKIKYLLAELESPLERMIQIENDLEKHLTITKETK